MTHSGFVMTYQSNQEPQRDHRDTFAIHSDANLLIKNRNTPMVWRKVSSKIFCSHLQFFGYIKIVH
jgi:hypothetical protein